MDIEIEHDALGTHFNWELDGVTPRMIDWFWSNMEKGFILWHPEQHEPLEWPVPPRHGDPLGAIHNAPQTWNDGRRQNLYIRFEKLAEVPADVRDTIVHSHVMIVAGLGLTEDEMRAGDPMGYRVHQWSPSDRGVVGRSSGIGRRKQEDAAAGRHQMPLLTHAAVMGANVRVGLEDSVYLGRGQLAPSNAAQVQKIRRILEELGLEIATPAEAREMLALKGGSNVAF